MKSTKTQQPASWKERLVYPARTTMAAVLALLAAQALGLAEVWWAPISALVVVQSDFGSSLGRLLASAGRNRLGRFRGRFAGRKYLPSPSRPRKRTPTSIATFLNRFAPIFRPRPNCSPGWPEKRTDTGTG